MIVRVFSPYGTRRITIEERESVNTLFDKIKKEFIIHDCLISRKPNGDELIQRSSKHLKSIGLKHGDIVYLHINQPMKSSNESEVDGDIKHANMTLDASQSKISLQEDEVDKILSKMDGQIYRPRNEQYCRHGLSGKCIHCVPLQPYDEQYLEHCDPPIQFMSFHAYLRKLSGGLHQGKFTTLENINCKIRPGCKEHLPWPEGICTKCQPSAVTLSVQKYRHVDNIMFENAALMNNFLDYWRRTGNQRIGILFGYYTTFDQAPLGIKAVVSAIYEPSQTSTSKSVQLSNLKVVNHCVVDGATGGGGGGRSNGSNAHSANEFLDTSVKEVAASLGLVPVGWIFTDLVSQDPKSGTVKHYRGTMDTYFLTAQECITAAFLQNLFPNICALSADGQFGSKFVTVVVTGDSSGSIHFEGYQVSNQCMALVRDDILLPTMDAPELGYIRESTGTQYVPDVFCMQKDKYGNSVTSHGRPLPVEFLLVHMSAAFPKEEHFSLTERPTPGLARFPIENRGGMGEAQSLAGLARYLAQFGVGRLGEALASAHVLWYLCGAREAASVRGEVRGVCVALRESVRGGNNDGGAFEAAVDALSVSEGWQAMKEVMRREGGGVGLGLCASTAAAVVGRSNGTTVTTDAATTSAMDTDATKVWGCEHCTFHNDLSVSSCQMCGLPR